MTTQHARQLRNNMTEAERRLWQRLKARQLHGMKFRRQQPIGHFVVDFACLERRLIVEVDGGQHAEQAQADSERSRWLESLGYQVLRFWNNEVMEHLDAVTQTIADALIAQLDPPFPKNTAE